MERRNYQREMEAEIERLDGRRPSLLLHSCCGPCSSAVLERLTEHFRVTVLYYNPNIEPEAEYLHRLSEQQRLLSLLPDDIPLLPCDYGHEAFAAFAPALAEAPEGGERCLACFALRLGYTAEQTKLRGFEYFTTTLSVSPHKNADNVNRIGAEAGERFGVRYLHADFKKKNGYRRSCEIASELGFYRQNFCGCEFSRRDTSAGNKEKKEEK